MADTQWLDELDEQAATIHDLIVAAPRLIAIARAAAAVIDQWPGDVPKPLLDMRAYMQGNINRMELALSSGRFGRPQ